MYIKVKILPGAKKEVCTQISPDHFDVSVRQKAEYNRANERLLEIMRDKFPDSIVKIVSGHHSRSKILSVEKR